SVGFSRNIQGCEAGVATPLPSKTHGSNAGGSTGGTGTGGRGASSGAHGGPRSAQRLSGRAPRGPGGGAARGRRPRAAGRRPGGGGHEPGRQPTGFRLDRQKGIGGLTKGVGGLAKGVGGVGRSHGSMISELCLTGRGPFWYVAGDHPRGGITARAEDGSL